MNLLKEGKTNWKYIIIVVVSAVVVGGGILGWIKMQEVSLVELPEVKKPEKIEVTEELANKIIDKIVLDTKKYDRERAEFFINDLNNDKTSEIIVCLATPASLSWEAGEIEAYMTVVVPTDKNGNYRTMGDFIFNKEEDTPFIGRPCIDDVKNLVDMDGDGKKEMIVNLGLIGVSGYAYTIFKIDWDLHKLNRMKVQNERRTVEEDYYFVEAAKFMTSANFYSEDIDNDGTTEIIERYYYRVGADEANWVTEIYGEKNYWQRRYIVYKWDGSILDYDEKLSNLLTETFNWKIYRNEKYGFEFKCPKEFAEDEKRCKVIEMENIIRIGRSIFITIEDSSGLSFFEYVDKENTLKIEPIKITVGGREALQIRYHYGAPEGCGNFVYLLKDNKIFKFSFASGKECPSADISEHVVFNGILSTFRFLE